MAEHHILDYDPSAASAYADLRNRQGLHIVDRLDDILTELYKADYPDSDYRPISPEEYRERQLGGKTPDAWGKWVYYPWRETLVHIPDEETFIRLRTLRNLYKITQKESLRLRQARIGVIGLSVGHSVAMAIAMERIAGEIRIADFDTLELGNMNRIRTGLHNLGVPKTTIVAREIAEIDPFIRVTCFPGGIDKDNIEAFFEEGGKLDVLVEECDSVEVKILARQVAKAKRVPVVMDTSDRLMIDIERFDLDPNYPIMHGMVDENLDYDFLKSLKTSKEKLPYILPFAGIDQISDRMAASALELGTSITSWPQLATEVQIGGALAAHYSKEIILKKSEKSGRNYFDSLILGFSSTPEKNDYRSVRQEYPLTDSDIKDYIIDRPVEIESNFSRFIYEILNEAISAPSPGNTQRWRFIIQNDSVIVLLDKKESASTGDNMDFASLLGIGALLENISLLSLTKGYKARVEIEKDTSKKSLATITFIESKDEINELVKYIQLRNTNRIVGSTKKLTEHELSVIALESSNFTQTYLGVVTEKEQIHKIGAIIREGDRIRMMNEQCHFEFFTNELRMTDEEAELYRSGLELKHLLLDESDKVGLMIAKRNQAIQFLKHNNLGFGLEKISLGAIMDTAALNCMFVKSYDREELLVAGMEMQRLWLRYTQLGIGVQPMTFIISLFSLLYSDTHEFLSESECRRLRVLQREFLEIMNGHGDRKIPIFLFRLHKNTGELQTSKRVELSKKIL